MKNLSSYNQDLSIPRKKDLDALETKVDGKQDAITGGASTITTSNLTANRALVSNGSGKVAVSAVTSTELGYLDGVTSNIQTQLNKKLESAPVTSVNGETGAVELDASDIGAVAKTGDTMTGNLTVGSASLQTNGYVTGTWLKITGNTALSSAASKIAVINDGWIYSRTTEQIKSDIGLGNVDNVKQYSTSNPPPYPVTSVNSKTGAVTLTASDIGAQPTITVNGIIKGDGAGNLSAQDTVTAELVDLPTVPTKVSELENDANYITAAQVPVQSVNSKTGAVVLTANDVGAATTSNINTALNRNNAVNIADSNYTTYMARGEALYSYETTPSANGCIAWTYA